MPNYKHESKFIFFYDALMTNQEREMIGINAKFVSLGFCKGSMYHYNDRKKLYTAVYPHGNKGVYGGIFLIENYILYRDLITAYYNSNTGTYGKSSTTSFYDFQTLKVVPIKIKKLSDLLTCDYKVGDSIDCVVPVINMNNPKLFKHVKKKMQRWYHINKRINKDYFITMIKEQENLNELGRRS